MASSTNEQDLLPDQTEGFKVGEKKTMDEYHKLGT
jgi:Rho GDP-dissociation inhibitor